MTEGEFCEHCDMAKAYCPHGNPQPVQVRPEDCTGGQQGATIEAAFPSECGTCGGQIDTGDPITLIDGYWVHVAPQQPAPEVEGLFDGI